MYQMHFLLSSLSKRQKLHHHLKSGVLYIESFYAKELFVLYITLNAMYDD
jgi:hypothetical protein